MRSETPGIVCALRGHGEHGAIVRLMTPEQGLIAAYVRGARGRRMRPVLMAGNVVQAQMSARNETQLPQGVIEMVHSRGPLLSEPLLAAAIDWATVLTAAALPEGQPYPRLYEALGGLLDAIEAAPSAAGWGAAAGLAEAFFLAGAFFAGAFFAGAFLALAFFGAALAFLADFFTDFLADFFEDFFADFLEDFFADFFFAVTLFLAFLAFLPFLLFFAFAIVFLLLPPIHVYRAFRLVRCCANPSNGSIMGLPIQALHRLSPNREVQLCAPRELTCRRQSAPCIRYCLRQSRPA